MCWRSSTSMDLGGKAGAHVLALLRELGMPIVTTLHTVLSAPNPAQRAVLEELARPRAARGHEHIRCRPADARARHLE